MQKKTQPIIRQIAIENVLIKHKSIMAFYHAKEIVKQAKKKANRYYQEYQEKINVISKSAYQQGYNDGLNHLIIDLINCIEESEKHYQSRLEQLQNDFSRLLTEFFHDKRLQEIITEYFINYPFIHDKKIIYLPDNLKGIFDSQNSNIQYRYHSSTDIILEFNDEIIQFSPLKLPSRILNNELSISMQCKILKERKYSYQSLMELIKNKIKNEYNR